MRLTTITIIIVFVASILLVTAAVAASISISNNLSQSPNPLVSSAMEYLVFSVVLLWISVALLFMLIIMTLTTENIIRYYTAFLIIIFLFILIAVILTGIATSQLRTSEPKDSNIASSSTASLVAFITSLLFLIALVIIGVELTHWSPETIFRE